MTLSHMQSTVLRRVVKLSEDDRWLAGAEVAKLSGGKCGPTLEALHRRGLVERRVDAAGDSDWRPTSAGFAWCARRKK